MNEGKKGSSTRLKTEDSSGDTNTRRLMMYDTRLDQRTTQLFTPSPIPLDTYRHPPPSFCVSPSYVFLKFPSPWTFFICWVRKRYVNSCSNGDWGTDSPAHTPVLFRKWKWESSPFPSRACTCHSRGRIKDCEQGDECFHYVTFKWNKVA